MEKVKKNMLRLSVAVLLLAGACGTKTEEKVKKASDSGEAPKEIAASAADPAQKLQTLSDAALDGDIGTVKKLMAESVDINGVIADGRTALMLAAFNGHADVINILVSAGAKVNMTDDFGRTALMYASTGPFPDAVKLLLNKGADPNMVDNVESFSPLMFAAAEGHLDVVNILIAANADHRLKDKDGDTAEAFARQNGHLEVAKRLEKL